MRQLGRYEILEQLGAGAMGNVYRARDTSLEREVALKTIRTGVDVDPEIRQRFYREARACARLQHPNIISVFDLGEVDNIGYIAMELLEGTDFRRIIQERRSVNLAERIAAAAEVCDAIAHAHRHGVVHRDIKPSNLFLTNTARAKVLDFGIARLPSSKLTVAGQILGTPNYMAPEQILARPSDGRSDLFSAAIVFFEFFSHAHPFQSKLIPQRIVQSEPDSLFDYNANTPLILEKVIARALSKEPDGRYQTGDEFASDLRAVLNAISGNSSPNLSFDVLPSGRIPPELPLTPIPFATSLVPEGQDPEEWRLSEALRLLPEFEALVEGRDAAGAEVVVATLEARLAGDIRFIEAIRLCRSRLSELVSNGNSSNLTRLDQSGLSAISDLPLPEVKTATGTSGKVTARREVDPDPTYFGSSFATTTFPRGERVPSSEPPPGDASLATLTVAQRPPEKRAATTSTNRRSRTLLGLAAAALICVCTVLILMVSIASQDPVTESLGVVATAKVGVPSVNLLVAGDPAAKRITSLTGGTELNVLRLPAARNQVWVNVQAVKPKLYRPGYVRIADLHDWRGKSGANSLALVRIFSSGESGNDQEITSEIRELANLVSRFEGQPAADEAVIEIARLRLVLARRYESMARPRGDWETDLKAAQQQLSTLHVDSSLTARAMALNEEIDTWLLSLDVAAQQRVPRDVFRKPPDESQSIAEARRRRLEGDYSGAAQILKNILREQPRNKEALELQDRLRQAHDAEKE
jgi:serine/threonine protein kinase